MKGIASGAELAPCRPMERDVFGVKTGHNDPNGRVASLMCCAGIGQADGKGRFWI